MTLTKKIFLQLLCSMFCITSVLQSTAQPCGGSWALQRPLTIQCVTGQWVGWENITLPPDCPSNPIYIGTQTNTFTFNIPVNSFSLDFIGFEGFSQCLRIEIKINGIFYPLTASNLSDFPLPTTCTSGTFNSVVLTSDGYITGNNTTICRGRIVINNLNTSTVTVSTNDVNGTVFSDPFSCTTIPLKLISFTGQGILCKVKLNWKTGIEQNVKIIDIERSEDAILFNKVGELNPKGSNSSYSFITDNSTDAFFRLKIIDLDGSHEYSEILYVKSACIKSVYTVNPNPTNSIIQVGGLIRTDWLLLSDITGRIISKFDPQANNKYDLRKLPAGMYIVRVVNSGTIKATLKLVKK